MASIGPKSFTIRTLPDKPLPRNVKLLFTVTLDSESASSLKEPTAFAWEVVSFDAQVAQEKSFTWHPARNMSLRRDTTFDKEHISEHIESGTYIEWGRDGAWDINPFFNGNDEQLIAINRSLSTTQFVLGAVPGTGAHKEFEPYVLLRELKAKEGLATKLPYCLQAYVVTQATKHHLVPGELQPGLFRKGQNDAPVRLDSLEPLTHWQLCSEGGAITLERFSPESPAVEPPTVADPALEDTSETEQAPKTESMTAGPVADGSLEATRPGSENVPESPVIKEISQQPSLLPTPKPNDVSPLQSDDRQPSPDVSKKPYDEQVASDSGPSSYGSEGGKDHSDSKSDSSQPSSDDRSVDLPSVSSQDKPAPEHDDKAVLDPPTKDVNAVANNPKDSDSTAGITGDDPKASGSDLSDSDSSEDENFNDAASEGYVDPGEAPAATPLATLTPQPAVSTTEKPTTSISEQLVSSQSSAETVPRAITQPDDTGAGSSEGEKNGGISDQNKACPKASEPPLPDQAPDIVSSNSMEKTIPSVPAPVPQPSPSLPGAKKDKEPVMPDVSDDDDDTDVESSAGSSDEELSEKSSVTDEDISAEQDVKPSTETSTTTRDSDNKSKSGGVDSNIGDEGDDGSDDGEGDLSTAPPDIPKVESPKESVPDSTAQTEHDTSPSSRLDPKPPVTDNEKLAVDATKQGSPVEGDVVQNNNSGVTNETNALSGESASAPQLKAEVAKPGDVPPSLDTKVSDDQTVREKSTPLDIKGADEANKSGPTEHHVPAAAPVPPEVVDTVDETVDLVPLQKALMEAARVIEEQIRRGNGKVNVGWGKAVLSQVGNPVERLLSDFVQNSKAWPGFVPA